MHDISATRHATIMGLGGSDHDVHACIVRNDRVVVNIEEERLIRRKYGIGGNLLEGCGRRYCLDYLGIGQDDVDLTVADSILAAPALFTVRKRARPIDHHLTHASAAFFTSPFDSAAVLVVDNAGGLTEDEDGTPILQATSWYHARGRDIRLLGRVGSTNWKEGPPVNGVPYQRGDGDHSLGHLYKKFTGALGFRFPSDTPPDGYYFPEDGITMGLASYGDQRFVETLWAHVELLPGGRYRLPLNDGRIDGLLSEWLAGEPAFEVGAAVAAAVQEVLTRVLCHVVEHLIDETGERNLCLGGGVAMNSSANGEILRRTRVERLHVPPVPGDNGTGVGAALWAATRDAGRPIPAYSVYGGAVYGEDRVEAAAADLGRRGFEVRKLDDDAMIAEVARRLAGGEVIGWFEGGSESGRRALGHRSLLADPRSAAMRDHINSDVKRRQLFRPFAPVVPEERAGDYFELSQPSPYMQIVFPVRPEKRAELAAVTHVDGSARVQTLNHDQHPRWYRLLHAFEALTGVPVLLNTSFNGKGEPIAETPEDAARCFEAMPIEGLVLENMLVTRT